MNKTVWVGRGKEITPSPRAEWENELLNAPEHCRKRLAFMTDEHHAIRNFVVRALPRYGRPISPHDIAERLEIPLVRVRRRLTELEQRLFFLVLDDAGAVEWAFPVTVAETGHRLRFSTGERLDAA